MVFGITKNPIRLTNGIFWFKGSRPARLEALIIKEIVQSNCFFMHQKQQSSSNRKIFVAQNGHQD
jgi:hypothetical protein